MQVGTDDSDSEHTHFAFGENWASYARLIGREQIDEAKRGLLRLLPAETLRDASFIDIGCGSGLHALAATQLGIKVLFATDIDPTSVKTTRELLERYQVGIPYRVEQRSVFDLSPEAIGRFDIVYSWGVLHHTGDLWLAIERAAALVKSGGLFVFALYRATHLDAFWKHEKRWYAKASPSAQRKARALYIGLMRMIYSLQGIDFKAFVANYKTSRGMDFRHDVHDWLGGFPYESTLSPEVESKLRSLGFMAQRVLALPMGRGMLGSGCDEYVYRKITEET